MGNSDPGNSYMRVGEDDEELRPWHCMYETQILGLMMGDTWWWLTCWVWPDLARTSSQWVLSARLVELHLETRSRSAHSSTLRPCASDFLEPFPSSALEATQG